MDEKLDPRYDPQYQRGFAGDAALPIARPVSPAPTGPQRVPSRPMPATAEPADPGDAPPADTRTATAISMPVLVERPLTANPFIWVLAIVGAAMVVAGIVLFTSWTSLARGGGDQPVDYALLQFLIQVTPVLLGLGGATLLGLGFVIALDRQRRTRTIVEDDGR